MSAQTPTPADPVGAFRQGNNASIAGSPSGPLSGTAFAAKDVFEIAGIRSGFGSPDWLATHPPATKTAEAIVQLTEAGARLAGKTHTDELCYSLAGENIHYGTPVNVNAPGRIPGGSSSGSAAAVAAGLVDFALGTDCGGSVRIPASYCGIIGLRPTLGRVSTHGVLEFAPSFDVVGWFARNGRLMRMVGDALLPRAGKPSEIKGLLIGADIFAETGDDARAALVPALEMVKSLFAGGREVNVSAERSRWLDVFTTIQGFEVWRSLGDWITAAKPKLGPGVADRIARAATVSKEAYEAAKAEQSRIGEEVEALLQGDRALCVPTSPFAAPLRDLPSDAIQVKARTQSMRILCIAGLSGLPQITLPLAKLDGLPLGLSLIGPRNSDEALLAMAEKLIPA